MTKWVVIIIFFNPLILFGQNPNDSLLAKFYNKTLFQYFSDTIIFKKKSIFDCILLQTDFDTNKLVKKVGLNKFKFFKSSTSIHSLLKRPFKKNLNRDIYWVNHKQFGNDTVDIVIGGWTIGNIDKKNISLGSWCGGTLGYIPNARFIHDNISNNWIYISREELINQAIESIKKLLRMK